MKHKKDTFRSYCELSQEHSDKEMFLGNTLPPRAEARSYRQSSDKSIIICLKPNIRIRIYGLDGMFRIHKLQILDLSLPTSTIDPCHPIHPHNQPRERQTEPQCAKLSLCTESKKGSNYKGTLYAVLPYNSTRGYISTAQTVTSRSHENNLIGYAKPPLHPREKYYQKTQ